MGTTLGEMQSGQIGRILGIRQGELAYRQKLLAMGLIPGTLFSVIRYAPLGDPVEIQVRGIALGLRKHEADVLLVEELEPCNILSL